MCSPYSSQLTTAAPELLQKLAALQTELVDLAYDLERQGRVDAADVAVTTATRIGELRAGLGPARHSS